MSRRARKYAQARPTWATHIPDDDRVEISQMLDALLLIAGLAPLGTLPGGNEATDAHDARQNEIEREMRGEAMR